MQILWLDDKKIFAPVEDQKVALTAACCNCRKKIISIVDLTCDGDEVKVIKVQNSRWDAFSMLCSFIKKFYHKKCIHLLCIFSPAGTVKSSNPDQNYVNWMHTIIITTRHPAEHEIFRKYLYGRFGILQKSSIEIFLNNRCVPDSHEKKKIWGNISETFHERFLFMKHFKIYYTGKFRKYSTERFHEKFRNHFWNISCNIGEIFNKYCSVILHWNILEYLLNLSKIFQKYSADLFQRNVWKYFPFHALWDTSILSIHFMQHTTEWPKLHSQQNFSQPSTMMGEQDNSYLSRSCSFSAIWSYK